LRRIVARGRRQKTEKHRKVLDFWILLLKVEVQPLDLKNRPVRKNIMVSGSTPHIHEIIALDDVDLDF